MTSQPTPGRRFSLRVRCGRLRTLAALTGLLTALIAAPAAHANRVPTPPLTPAPPPAARCATSPAGTVCNFTVERWVTDEDFGVTCADGSEVLQTYDRQIRFTVFYGPNGVWQETIRHYTFTGTLRDSAGGTPVPFVTQYTAITYYDAAGNPVRTVNSGAVLRVTTATGQQQIVAAGREIWDYPLADFVFGAGPSMGADWDPAVICPLVQ
jgi:hypothetical protein